MKVLSHSFWLIFLGFRPGTTLEDDAGGVGEMGRVRHRNTAARSRPSTPAPTRLLGKSACPIRSARAAARWSPLLTRCSNGAPKAGGATRPLPHLGDAQERTIGPYTVTCVPTSTTRPVGMWKKSVASLADRAKAMKSRSSQRERPERA
jgi:hypothetical protein